MKWFELSDKLKPYLRKGDLDYCMCFVTKTLRELPESPFHQVIGLMFTNKPKDVAAYFDRFIKRESKRFMIQSLYTEMNDFDINPDRWLCDLFALDFYGGHEDYEWLCDWQSDPYPSMTLAGMEALQRVYDSDSFNNENEAAYTCSSFLVVLRFQDLIRESMALIKDLAFPVLANSHDYDFIYEYRPSIRGEHHG